MRKMTETINISYETKKRFVGWIYKNNKKFLTFDTAINYLLDVIEKK